ncbi:MAG: endolytic transglycosylase MltG [bacterium]
MDEFSLNNEPRQKMSRFNKSQRNILYFLLILFLFVFFYSFFLSPPKDFQPGTIIKIEQGMGLHSVSAALEKQNIIRSRIMFEFFVLLFGGERHTVSANYLFENSLYVWQVASRVVGGEHDMARLVVTIPEGFNLNQIADTFSSKLVGFDKTQFLVKAKAMEGYLFPDTYFFLNNSDEMDVIKYMNDNYKKKIAELLPEIIALGKNENDIIIMASIIEKEAKGDADRSVISGILWKRIKIGMPLQVDVAPQTYKEKGLTEKPIGNPGIEAIKAAIFPQSSPYLYYLHDRNGIIHYAKSFSEHTKNITKYLSARGGK